MLGFCWPILLEFFNDWTCFRSQAHTLPAQGQVNRLLVIHSRLQVQRHQTWFSQKVHRSHRRSSSYGWLSEFIVFSCISKHGEQCWSMLKLSWFRSAHLVCPITMTGFDVHWIAFRFTLSCHFKILQMLLLVSSCTSDWTCLRSQPRYQKHRQVQLEESLALSRRLEEKGQDIRINRPFERMLLQFVFPHIFLWGSCFWFCIPPPPPPPSPPPPPPPPSHSHNFVTHHISHTFSLTQLCHTPSFTHHLTHTTLSHTISLNFLTYNFVRHTQNFVTHHLSHTFGWVLTPCHFAWQAWHLVTSTFVLPGRRGTWRHQPWFCVAGVALGAMCEVPFDAVKKCLCVSEYGTTNGLTQCVKNLASP